MKDQVDGLVAQGVAAACLHSGQSARATSRGARPAARRHLPAALRRARARRRRDRRRVPGADGRARRGLCRHRRSALHQPVGPRLPAGVPAAGRVARGVCRHVSCTPTPPRRRHACSATSAISCGWCGRSCTSARSIAPNLTYRVLPRVQFRQQLQTILRRHEGEAGIIYCLSRREVDELAATLAADGIRALPYHAGLDDATRHRNQDAFLNEEVDVMVATVAFGMGIDRSDVRFVVHAGAPQSLEQYQQEAGRAGRDGLPAECALVTSPADFARWRSLLESDGQWTDSARTLLRDMERYAAATSCRHRALVGYFGQDLPPGSCGACDWCLAELERSRRAKGAGAEDLVGRRAYRTTMGRGPRRRRAPRRVDRDGDGARPPRPQRLRLAARGARPRTAWVHRPAHAGRVPHPHRRSVPDAADQPDGRRPAARTGRVRAVPPTSAGERPPTPPGSANRCVVGGRGPGGCSRSCARCAWSWRGAGACRRTSSSTTRRYASWRG